MKSNFSSDFLAEMTEITSICGDIGGIDVLWTSTIALETTFKMLRAET